VPRDATITWSETKAPSSLERDSRSLPYWASCAEGEESFWGQSMREDWKEKVYREEEEKKMTGVFEEILG